MSEEVIKTFRIPIKKELLLTGASKAINCIAWDSSGARVISGSSDHVVRMYDFGGMTVEHGPFHEFTVAEGQSVFCLNYSPSSDQFIATTADAKPVVYDKNGNKRIVFIKGNPYVLDNTKTPGHTNTVRAAQWHPNKYDTVMTASLDGTCRIWDLNGTCSFNELESLRVFQVKNKRGLRTSITSGVYNLDGNQIILGCTEGGVVVYDERNRLSRPVATNFATHSDQVVDLRLHPSGQVFTSRGLDSVVCLWDIRNVKSPLKKYKNINTFGYGCNITFSPDGKLMAMAVPTDLDNPSSSHINIYDVFDGTLKPIFSHQFASGLVPFSILWHSKLNQMIVGMRDGSLHCLYDPEFSLRGAVMVEGRTKKKRVEMQFGNMQNVIYAPESNDDDLRDSRDEPKKRDNRPGKPDPYAAPYQELLHSGGRTAWQQSGPKIPETGLPMISGGQGLGFEEAEVLSGVNKEDLNMDPREALIRHEKDKKKDKEVEYFANVFKKNQPTPVFSKRTLEQDLDEEEERKRKRITINH